MQNPDFQKWLSVREAQDATQLISVMRSDDFKPYARGKIDGRLELILELRASETRTRAALQAFLKELEQRQT